MTKDIRYITFSIAIKDLMFHFSEHDLRITRSILEYKPSQEIDLEKFYDLIKDAIDRGVLKKE